MDNLELYALNAGPLALFALALFRWFMHDIRKMWEELKAILTKQTAATEANTLALDNNTGGPSRRPPAGAIVAALIAVAAMFALAGCANLSAERNQADAEHAATVLEQDTPDSTERAQVIADLHHTKGTATQEAVAAMDGAAEHWQHHAHPDLHEHVATARRRFWKEAKATARQAFEHR